MAQNASRKLSCKARNSSAPPSGVPVWGKPPTLPCPPNSWQLSAPCTPFVAFPQNVVVQGIGSLVVRLTTGNKKHCSGSENGKVFHEMRVQWVGCKSTSTNASKQPQHDQDVRNGNAPVAIQIPHTNGLQSERARPILVHGIGVVIGRPGRRYIRRPLGGANSGKVGTNMNRRRPAPKHRNCTHTRRCTLGSVLLPTPSKLRRRPSNRRAPKRSRCPPLPCHSH